MSMKQVKACDGCGSEIGYLEGARLAITEFLTSGDSRRVYPQKSGTVELDFCTNCYKGLADAIKVRLGPRVIVGM